MDAVFQSPTRKRPLRISLPDTFMRVLERLRADDEDIAHLERKRRKGELDRPNKQNPLQTVQLGGRSCKRPSLLLEQWTRQVKEIFPHLHGHQQKSLPFPVLEVALTGEGVLRRMAEEISLALLERSHGCPSIQRNLLHGLFENERIDALTCWQAFLAHFRLWHNKEVILVLDCTPYGGILPSSIWAYGSSPSVAPGLENHAATNRVGTRAMGLGARTLRPGRPFFPRRQLYLARHLWSQFASN